MPFVNRTVTPSRVSHTKVDKTVRDELEFVTECTLANLIRQMSTVAQHASDIFSNVHDELTLVHNRVAGLAQRVEVLNYHIEQLDSSTEECKSHNAFHRPFCCSSCLIFYAAYRTCVVLFDSCDPVPGLLTFDCVRQQNSSRTEHC